MMISSRAFPVILHDVVVSVVFFLWSTARLFFSCTDLVLYYPGLRSVMAPQEPGYRRAVRFPHVDIFSDTRYPLCRLDRVFVLQQNDTTPVAHAHLVSCITDPCSVCSGPHGGKSFSSSSAGHVSGNALLPFARRCYCYCGRQFIWTSRK